MLFRRVIESVGHGLKRGEMFDYTQWDFRHEQENEFSHFCRHYNDFESSESEQITVDVEQILN